MGQITRGHEGSMTISADLLDSAWWALSMNEAPPRSVIAPLAARVNACYAAGRDPERDDELVDAARKLRNDLPVYLDLLSADALQRMRGWNRLRYGSIRVKARDVSDIRNLVDGLTISDLRSCEQWLDEMVDESDDDYAEIKAKVAADQLCGECEFCEFLALRDRLDGALDAFCCRDPKGKPYCCSYYWAYR